MSNKLSIELSNQTIHEFFNLIKGPTTCEKIAEDISYRSFDLLERFIIEKMSKNRREAKKEALESQERNRIKENYIRKRRRVNSEINNNSLMSYHPYSVSNGECGCVNNNSCPLKNLKFSSKSPIKSVNNKSPPPVHSSSLADSKRPDVFRSPSPTFGNDKCVTPVINETKSPSLPKYSVYNEEKSNIDHFSTNESKNDLLFELLRRIIMDYSTISIALMNKDFLKLDYFLLGYIRKFSDFFKLNGLYESMLIYYSKIALKYIFEKYGNNSFFNYQEPPKNTSIQEPKENSSFQETNSSSSKVPIPSLFSQTTCNERDEKDETQEQKENSSHKVSTPSSSLRSRCEDGDEKDETLQKDLYFNILGNVLDQYFKQQKEITDILKECKETDDLLNEMFLETTNNKSQSVEVTTPLSKDNVDNVNIFEPMPYQHSRKDLTDTVSTECDEKRVNTDQMEPNKSLENEKEENHNFYLKLIDNILSLIPDSKLREDLRNISNQNETSPGTINFDLIKDMMNSLGLPSDIYVNLLKDIITNEDSLKCLTKAVGVTPDVYDNLINAMDSIAKIENINSEDDEVVKPLE